MSYRRFPPPVASIAFKIAILIYLVVVLPLGPFAVSSLRWISGPGTF